MNFNRASEIIAVARNYLPECRADSPGFSRVMVRKTEEFTLVPDISLKELGLTEELGISYDFVVTFSKTPQMVAGNGFLDWRFTWEFHSLG